MISSRMRLDADRASLPLALVWILTADASCSGPYGPKRGGPRPIGAASTGAAIGFGVGLGGLGLGRLGGLGLGGFGSPPPPRRAWPRQARRPRRARRPLPRRAHPRSLPARERPPRRAHHPTELYPRPRHSGFPSPRVRVPPQPRAPRRRPARPARRVHPRSLRARERHLPPRDRAPRAPGGLPTSWHRRCVEPELIPEILVALPLPLVELLHVVQLSLSLLVLRFLDLELILELPGGDGGAATHLGRVAIR